MFYRCNLGRVNASSTLTTAPDAINELCTGRGKQYNVHCMFMIILPVIKREL